MQKLSHTAVANGLGLAGIRVGLGVDLRGLMVNLGCLRMISELIWVGLGLVQGGHGVGFSLSKPEARRRRQEGKQQTQTNNGCVLFVRGTPWRKTKTKA